MGDGKVIIISITVSGKNDHIRFYSKMLCTTAKTLVKGVPVVESAKHHCLVRFCVVGPTVSAVHNDKPTRKVHCNNVISNDVRCPSIYEWPESTWVARIRDRTFPPPHLPPRKLLLQTFALSPG